MTQPAASAGRILLVEDDPQFAASTLRLLESRGGFEVVQVPDAPMALRLLETEEWDLVITDIGLPGMSGLGLLEKIRATARSLPIAVLTGQASTENAVGALRGQADDFLPKPVPPAELLRRAGALIAAGREARAAARETVLAVGAHPDDVEIGAGGSLLAHQARGHQLQILTLCRGATGGQQEARAREAESAAEAVGARLILADLEDTHISESMPTISIISDVVAEVNPTIVYTHSLHDVHQDHRNVHRATLVASRKIGRVYCFQSPSATVDFRPTGGRVRGREAQADRELRLAGHLA